MALLFLLHTATLIMAALANNTFKLPCGVPYPMHDDNIATLQGLANGTIDPGTNDGSSDLFGKSGFGGPIPWPRNKENKVVIKYCYEFSWVKYEKFSNSQFDIEGVERWLNALGGRASKTSGHALDFQEAQDEHGKPIWCYKPNTPDGESWDERLDYDTLAIGWDSDPGVAGQATTGYVQTPKKKPRNMQIKFGPGWGFPTLVHELGHVLGMAHEHQRDDRDTYVNFRCHLLTDFADKLKELQKTKPSATYADLCSNLANAASVGFSGRDYIKGWALGDGRPDASGKQRFWNPEAHGQGYDYVSVMHYGSLFNSPSSCQRDSTDTCPLVGYNKPGDGSAGYFYLLNQVAPSAADVLWAKTNYPWQDPPS